MTQTGTVRERLALVPVRFAQMTVRTTFATATVIAARRLPSFALAAVE
jgi:hypothetical protein